ncbi:MAG TPA: SRPBCC domain-containing protein [Thermoanaerobaculia bacterium]|nr:SRPBCC domain-containing protein [Thermoanaerobaculia bacterium]
MERSTRIVWPDPYSPSGAALHVHNELLIAAAPAAVWAWLVRAALWPAWYPNSHDVRFEERAGPDLALGMRFRWRTFGVAIRSQVLELVPPERIAWDALRPGLRAYHAWLIESEPGGCRVVTEETQRGLLPRLGGPFLPRRMRHFHQLWLERLRWRAEGGLPPARTDPAAPRRHGALATPP